jgi:hypothetical protein
MTREEPSLETLWLKNIGTMDKVQKIDRRKLCVNITILDYCYEEETMWALDYSYKEEIVYEHYDNRLLLWSGNVVWTLRY